MKNKVFKISVILVMILSMTMTNFIFVGKSLISYAADGTATNHKNVEFEAYFKEEEGKEVTTLEKEAKKEETFLYLRLNVKREGYFNGEITLENSNFTLKETDSAYVNKIENNTIYLNQISVGTTEEIKVRIEPIEEENFTIGLLDMTSKISVKGIYRDSTEKDIKIQANRDVTLKLVENNTPENIQNEIKVITNKIVEIDGQEKRILQFSYHMGLKENNYPMQAIYSKIAIPTINGKQPEIEKIEYLNNMTNLDYQYDGTNVELTLKNELNEEGKAIWKAQGTEEVILTCVYDKEVEIKNASIHAYEKVTLYNRKEIEAENKITLGEEEIDSILEIQANNEEEKIYKGKLNAGIDRLYQSTTQVRVNYAKALPEIEVTEKNSRYVMGEEEQVDANVIYNKTLLSKQQFDKIFGENGNITIYNQDKNIVDTITSETPVDAEGNIVIDYEEKNVTSIYVQATAPVKEGTLTFKHTKTICANGNSEMVKTASEIRNTIMANEKKVEATMPLENSTTKATLEVNKESLSTVVSNHVEIKAVLTSNDEKYELHKNPEIQIQLPEQVENIEINSMDILYENELKIRDYFVNGRTIYIALEGEQTQYKEGSIEGATIVMNTTIDVNRRVATSDQEISMTYKNQEMGNMTKPIKIVAPTDITTIYNVQDLGIETLGEEENKQVLMQRGTEGKQLEAQIEVINNKEEAIEKARILGDFPTNHSNNNMEIKILEGITLQGIEEAKIYYSENEKATDEIENPENGWSETITDSSKVSKYLIAVDTLESGNSIQGGYTYGIPANLEYNQTAETEYKVKYASSKTQVESELASTNIEMKTGVGPKVETKLMATSGGKEINGSVKNGEVIQYRIEVSNTGSEDVEGIEVSAKVPEGTTRVVPEENYEYTGASYYQELDDKTYKDTIDLKVGEVKYVSYEVRVNNQVAEGTTLSNMAQIKYGDVTKQSEEIKTTTAKGNLRVSVKRITDRNVELYTNGVVQYFAIIENISGKKQENVKIQTNLPENLEVKLLTLYTGMEKEEGEVYSPNSTEEKTGETESNTTAREDNLKSEILSYAKEVNIGTVEAGETKVLSYNLFIKNAEDGINFSVTAKSGQEQYPSNGWQEDVKKIDIGISMTANTQNQSLKAGDVIEYAITLKNRTNADTTGIQLKDTLPTQLTIQKVTQDGENVEEIEGNDLILPIKIAENETTNVKIEAVVNYSEARDRAEAITNIAYAELYGEKIATTAEVSHILQANENSQPQKPNEDDEDDDPNNQDIANGEHIITGVAWYDENANGQKEQGEKLLKDIKVRLLNTQTNRFVKEENGQILEATTNENGIYVLDQIGNGKYIVIFDYDDTQYALTKYKVDGVSETENSNAVVNELLIENERKQVASTDMIELQDYDISNINIGFIKLENFDLKLDKYVSKILIQNAKGTTVREYNKETMAKVELDAKTINGSTVLVEYQIEVTNNGEVDGYAKKIADYATSDLKFSSELNKDWYQVGDTLYTNSLANEKIKAGETKTVTLTLTKSMTENNTGLIPNIAEIAEDYNELGIADSNSTPGNRAKGENDMSSAEVLLSIRTGGIIYATIGIIVVAMLAMVAFVIIKKRNKEEKE